MAQLVECKARDLKGLLVRDSLESLLFPGRHFIYCLVLVQPRKTGNHPDMTEKLYTGI